MRALELIMLGLVFFVLPLLFTSGTWCLLSIVYFRKVRKLRWHTVVICTIAIGTCTFLIGSLVTMALNRMTAQWPSNTFLVLWIFVPALITSHLVAKHHLKSLTGLEVGLSLSIIMLLARLPIHGSPNLRPIILSHKLKDRAIEARRGCHPLDIHAVQAIVSSQNWRGYEISLAGTNEEWTLVCASRNAQRPVNLFGEVQGLWQPSWRFTLCSSNLEPTITRE